MQSMLSSADSSGFFVEWQLAEAGGDVIDLSAEEPGTEVVLPDDADVRTSPGT